MTVGDLSKRAEGQVEVFIHTSGLEHTHSSPLEECVCVVCVCVCAHEGEWCHYRLILRLKKSRDMSLQDLVRLEDGSKSLVDNRDPLS